MANVFISLALISFFLLIIGLVKPSLFKRIFSANRARIALAFGGGFILFFVLFGITSDASKDNEKPAIVPLETKSTSSLPIGLNADTIKRYSEESPLNFFFDEEKVNGSNAQLSGYASLAEEDPSKTSHINISFEKTSRKISYAAVYLIESSYHVPQADITKLSNFVARIDSTAGKFINKNLNDISNGDAGERDFESGAKGLHFQIIENVTEAKALEKRNGKSALAGYDYYVGVEIMPTK